MSYDLLVWHELIRMTCLEVRRKVLVAETRGDWTAFHPHPNVPAFRAAVLERFPPLESLDVNDPAGVWSATPAYSDRLVILPMRLPLRPFVIEFIADLVEEFDLVIVDELRGWAQVPRSMTRLLGVSTISGDELRDPEPDVVVHQVRKALAAGAHVRVRDGIGCLADATLDAHPAKAGTGYHVEIYDAEGHRAYVAELDDVLTLFDAFARDDDRYRFLLDERGCSRRASR